MSETGAVRDQVRGWFEGLGWQVEDRPAEDGVAWRLRARHRGGQSVAALQQEARPDLLLLGGSVAPSGPHPKKLAALSPKAMRVFLWELRFELLRQRYQFQIQGPGVQRVTLNRTLYWDEGIQRSQFFSAVEEIHHGVLTVQWMIQRLLDEPVPETVKVVGFEPVN
jgi:hypothetical protein